MPLGTEIGLGLRCVRWGARCPTERSRPPLFDPCQSVARISNCWALVGIRARVFTVFWQHISVTMGHYGVN